MSQAIIATPFESADIKNAKYFYYVESMPKWCTERIAWLDWFTSRQRPVFTFIYENKPLVSDIIKLESTSPSALKMFDNWPVIHVASEGDYSSEVEELSEKFIPYGVLKVPGNNQALMLIKLSENSLVPPFTMAEQFMLDEGMIANYKGNPTVTDVGKFFLNYLLLVQPFESLGTAPIPYVNKQFKPGDIDDAYAKLILDKKCTRKEYTQYMRNVYAFGEDGSLGLSAWSEKSLTTDPAIRKRKEELFKRYKDKLNDPTVLTKIEEELIALDKQYIKGDDSEAFYMYDPGKSFGDQRKKFFFTFGISMAFSKNSGDYVLTESSLEKGWDKEELPNVANQIRLGSYGRGKETAKGGVQTKFVMRIFQNVKLDEQDCHATRGLKVSITPDNYKFWEGRYPVGEDAQPYTLETLKSLIGQEVELRSPMYCTAAPGYCAKCCGANIEKIGIEAVGLQALTITSAMTTVSMKQFHSTKIDPYTLKNFNKFLRK